MGSILNLFELLEKITIGKKSCCLELSMDGVCCLDSLLKLSTKINSEVRQSNSLCMKGSPFAHAGVCSLSSKVSTLYLELLKTKWPENTKFNKSNIGKLVELYIDNSWISVFNRDIDKIELSNFGHVAALRIVIKDVLMKLPESNNCVGPVEAFPTCCYNTFGSYFSAAFTALPKEVIFLFISKFNLPIESTLLVLDNLISLLTNLFNLTQQIPNWQNYSFF